MTPSPAVPACDDVSEVLRSGRLVLHRDRVETPAGTITLDDLPNPRPELSQVLHGTSPLVERLWRVALADVEANVVGDGEGHRYFGAGKNFGLRVYTRDIAYAGVMGLNRLYPELMRASLEYTRQVRFDLGWTVASCYVTDEIDAPWNIEELPELVFVEKYKTNGIMRRTDDVIWLWAAGDLLTHQPGTTADDWRWLYDTGRRCFETFYDPMLDPADGLYRGQASFIDIHFPHKKATGYPLDWSITDCYRVKATSTNALYFRGLGVMAEAAAKLGLSEEADAYRARAAQLKAAMLEHLRRADGTWAYYKDRWGTLSARREAHGAAFVVLFGIVAGQDARDALAGYPVRDTGIPTFWPAFNPDAEGFYHDNGAWPLGENIFLQAWALAHGSDTTELQAALLARSCVDDGTFHEVLDFRDGLRAQGPSQLWTAASFLGVCLRQGLQIAEA